MWATCVSMVRAGQSGLLIGDFTFTFRVASDRSALVTLAGRGILPATGRGWPRQMTWVVSILPTGDL